MRLFRSRYHGAGNHSAVLYHAIYAGKAAFDLYRQGGPTRLLSEGIEDVDLSGGDSGHTYVQLKHHDRPLTLTAVEDVLRSFMPVLDTDPTARFVLVASGGFVTELARFAEHGRRTMRPPAALRDRARRVAGSVARAELLLDRLSLEIVPLQDLEVAIERAVINHFSVDNATVPLYVNALLALMAKKASQREVVSKADLEALRATVWEELSLGPQNLAVQSGLVELVEFKTDHRVEDFYEGKSARAAHVAGNLDVPRPRCLRDMQAVVDQVQVCAVVASSGQGKSTLAYRFAYDSGSQATVLLVRARESDEHAGSIEEFLRNRLRIGLALTVIIDNLGYRTRAWSALVERLIGEPVTFLITAREEDWKRFGLSTVAFPWRAIRPSLTLDEARQMFNNLRDRDLVHLTVRSAEWAYEQVHDSGLLIEFVYLLTHGQLLKERIVEQVAKLDADDPGRVEALRLVSVADGYGTPLALEALLANAAFRGDPLRSVESLVDEYFSVSNGECSGLHPVRSAHLRKVLSPYGTTNTVVRICEFLDIGVLPAFVRGALADPEVDRVSILHGLVRRCVDADRGSFAALWEACFAASEDVWIREMAGELQEVQERFGTAGIHLITFLAMPNSPDGLLDLRLLYGEEDARQIEELSARLRSRNRVDRLEAGFVKLVLEHPDIQLLMKDARFASQIILAALNSKLAPEQMRPILAEVGWQSAIWDLPLNAFCDLALATQRVAPTCTTRGLGTT